MVAPRERLLRGLRPLRPFGVALRAIAVPVGRLELGLFVCREFEWNAYRDSGRYTVLETADGGSPGEIRTPDQRINSPSLYH